MNMSIFEDLPVWWYLAWIAPTACFIIAGVFFFKAWRSSRRRD